MLFQCLCTRSRYTLPMRVLHLVLLIALTLPLGWLRMPVVEAADAPLAMVWGDTGEFVSPPYTFPSMHWETTPMQVLFPLGVRIAAVAAGGSDGRRQRTRGHSVALASDGTVWDWGYLGATTAADGTMVVRSSPVLVPGLRDVVAVAAGADHSVALRRDGTVWTWDARQQARQVAGMARITAIAAGGDFTLGLRDDGTVWQLMGADPRLFPNAPTAAAQVPDLGDVVAIAAGGRAFASYDGSYNFHGLALKRDGTVWNWGAVLYDQLGEGVQAESPYHFQSSPVQLPALRDVAALGAGNTFSLVVGSDGRVSGWGSNNSGQLGTASAEQCGYSPPPSCQRTPLAVPGLTDIRAVAGGDRHSVALRRDGTVWGWGANDYAQLGSGAVGAPRPTPAPIGGLTAITAIAAGFDHTLALRADGTVWAWGLNEDGEVGNGISNRQPVPLAAPLPAGVVPAQLAAGLQFSLALAEDGRVWGWGTNSFLQLGDGPSQPRAIPLPGLTDVTAIAAAYANAWALKRDGTVWCLGYRDTGPSSYDGHPTAVPVQGLDQIVGIAGGYGHGLALKVDGTVWVVQANRVVGQVAGLPAIRAVTSGFSLDLALARDGSVWAWHDWYVPSVDVPVAIPGLGGVRAIAAGGLAFLALNADGTVVTGQRASGPGWAFELHPLPALADIIAVAAGGVHNLALRRDGTVWTWGNNSAGQLGDGTLTDRADPVQVRGLTGVTAIAAGEGHSLAITGRQRCFAETGYCVSGSFLDYWEQRGGLAQFGFPLTPLRYETLEDGRVYAAQWFERVRLEYHPENAAPHDILLGQFGRLIHPAEPPVAPDPGGTFFPATGHNLAPRFARYWAEHGGLPQFGYPLTEAFTETLPDGRAYTVQYFERARFEWHPENASSYEILLGQFGRTLLQQRGGQR